MDKSFTAEREASIENLPVSLQAIYSNGNELRNTVCRSEWRESHKEKLNVLGIRVIDRFCTPNGTFYEGVLPTGEKVMIKEPDEKVMHGGHVELMALVENYNNPYSLRYRGTTVSHPVPDSLVKSPKIRIITERVTPGTTASVVAKKIHALLKPHERGIVSTALGLQVAGGLHYMHTNSPPRLHRDVKPDNLLLAQPSQERGFIRIIDFGIASPDPIHEAAFCRFEESNMGVSIWGSAPFMGPELFVGTNFDRKDRVLYSEKSDIYALGWTLFCLLNNNIHPYEKPDALDTLQAHHSAEFPGGTLMDVYGSDGREFVEIIECCCQKNPDARFSSMQGLGNALHAVLSKTAPEMLDHCGPVRDMSFFQSRKTY